MILLDGKPIDINSRFPDGTSALRLDAGNKEESPKKVLWRYESDVEMVILYYVTKHLKCAGFSVALYMPYIPNARMDRVKNDDEVFTLKYFAEFINSLEYEYVYVMDPHSAVSCALINNLVIDDCRRFITEVITDIGDDEILLYYPDEGAMKRYSDLLRSSFNRPYAFGIKNRDWRSGEILGLSLINGDIVEGKNVLIVDDICSKGGTFYHSAKALKDAGAKDIFLYITHCENTVLKGDLINSEFVKHIYTTDSIFSSAHKKITTFNIV